MKMIKVSDELHSKLLPKTTAGGKKRTLNDVIDESIAPIPYANFREISFDNFKGRILVADFTKDKESPDSTTLKSTIAIEANEDEQETDLFSIVSESKNIEFSFFLDGEGWHTLKCNDFYIDPHYATEDVLVFFLNIDNYMNYSKKDK